jgi:hypothetical protein
MTEAMELAVHMPRSAATCHGTVLSTVYLHSKIYLNFKFNLQTFW